MAYQPKEVMDRISNSHFIDLIKETNEGYKKTRQKYMQSLDGMISRTPQPIEPQPIETIPDITTLILSLCGEENSPTTVFDLHLMVVNPGVPDELYYENVFAYEELPRLFTIPLPPFKRLILRIRSRNMKPLEIPFSTDGNAEMHLGVIMERDNLAGQAAPPPERSSFEDAGMTAEQIALLPQQAREPEEEQVAIQAGVREQEPISVQFGDGDQLVWNQQTMKLESQQPGQQRQEKAKDKKEEKYYDKFVPVKRVLDV